MNQTKLVVVLVLALGLSTVESRLYEHQSKPTRHLTGSRFYGDGTAYSDRISDDEASDFACSFQTVNDWVSDHFVAINAEQWNDGKNCGRCVRVECIDDDCPIQNKEVVMMVVDRCDPCEYGDLDMSTSMFKEVTGMHWDRKKISWTWSTCSPYIDGPIKMHQKEGSSRYWSAFLFSNLKYRIAKATLNGDELEQDEYNFWYTHKDQGKGPYRLELTTYPIGNKVLKTSITEDDIYKKLEIPQFSWDNAVSANGSDDDQSVGVNSRDHEEDE